MKHSLLAALALASLTVGASAQTSPSAASAGLAYNRIGFSRVSQKTVPSYNELSASMLLGSSNFLASVQSTTSRAAASLSLGYVFRNVIAGVDATVSVGSDNSFQGYDSIYAVNLRRSLGELIPGLEVALGYSYQPSPSGQNGATIDDNRILSYEISYALPFNKQYSVAYGVQDIRKGSAISNGFIAEKIHSITVRYNF